MNVEDSYNEQNHPNEVDKDAEQTCAKFYGGDVLWIERQTRVASEEGPKLK